MTQLRADGLKQAEYTFNTWCISPEHGTDLDAVLDSAYWAHVSARLKPWDVIKVMPVDGTYYAELLVRDAGRLYAKVAVLSHKKFEEEEVVGDEQANSDLREKFRGPIHKWCVLRKDDVLKEGLSTKAEALFWIQEHLKTVR